MNFLYLLRQLYQWTNKLNKTGTLLSTRSLKPNFKALCYSFHTGKHGQKQTFKKCILRKIFAAAASGLKEDSKVRIQIRGCIENLSDMSKIIYNVPRSLIFHTKFCKQISIVMYLTVKGK